MHTVTVGGLVIAGIVAYVGLIYLFGKFAGTNQIPSG